MKIEKLTTPPDLLTKNNKYDTLDSSAASADSFRVTKISPGVKDQNRINLFINEHFFCSLDIAQLADLKLKTGQILTASQLEELKRASDFGKLYTRALEYALMRPRSAREINDYLKRKTQDRFVRVKNRQTNIYETIKKPGFDTALVQPVLARLTTRGFIDDAKFARIWVENRHVQKGISRRRLEQELIKKGIKKSIIDDVLSDTNRQDTTEIAKIIAKKRAKYDDQKLIQYLVRQGFDFESARTAVLETDSRNSA